MMKCKDRLKVEKLIDENYKVTRRDIVLLNFTMDTLDELMLNDGDEIDILLTQLIIIELIMGLDRNEN